MVTNMKDTNSRDWKKPIVKWVKRTAIVVLGAFLGFVGFGIFYVNWHTMVILDEFASYREWSYNILPAIGGLVIIVVGVAVADCALVKPVIRGGIRFWAALLTALIPISVVSISSMIALRNTWEKSSIEPFLYSASGLLLTILVLAIIFAIKRRKEISRGMWVAGVLGVIFLLAAWSNYHLAI